MAKTKIEILAPVGNSEMLKAAVFSGANAVYLGLEDFNARKSAANFAKDDLFDLVKMCHGAGVKVNVTLNTLVYDFEMENLYDTIKAVALAGADAVIVQDLATAFICKRLCPTLCL
ncbi:MAG: U32 family peptidase, partial [Oscillospiraceae bacterium]